MKTPGFMKMLLASTALVLTLSNCGSDDPSPAKKSTDIYLAGSYNTLTAPQYNWVPAYWKNGELVQLETENGNAKAIAVIGNDVYVVGKMDANDDQFVLWTNGEQTYLTNTDEYDVQYEYVFGMKVFGSDWYAWGATYTSEFGERATYWKNGDIHIAETDHDSRAYDLTVAEGDVYIVGFEGHVNGNNVPTVWVNDDNTGTPLTDGSINMTGIGVSVSNGHVYVLGAQDENLLLWKDNEISSLNTDNIKGGAYASLVVLGDDIYISGYDNTDSGYKAYLWKNGIEVDLDIPETITETYGSTLLAVGNDVFMLGEAKISGSTEYTTLVWKNGELTDEFDGTVLAQHAYSLSVK